MLFVGLVFFWWEPHIYENQLPRELGDRGSNVANILSILNSNATDEYGTSTRTIFINLCLNYCLAEQRTALKKTPEQNYTCRIENLT